ncbi:hypothetical protein Taro_052248 [Colocasia esculenta]|uniref:Uncharacterized protein n=1 Tax=Colocasia esculenta TaxID=4460 RepID=A0A843XHY6_COLES|nr:hypothetical protein [Colocasia esculenta]
MAATCLSSGSQLTSALGRRRSPRSRSGRDGGAHRDPNRCAFLREFWPDRAGASSARPRRSCCGGFGRFEVLVEFLARSLCEDIAWSGGDAVPSSVCAFFVKATALGVALLT